MKPVDSNMSLGVPAHVTENLRQADIPPTSHPCIVSASPAPPTLLLTAQGLQGNRMRNWEGECGCSGPSSGIPNCVALGKSLNFSEAVSSSVWGQEGYLRFYRVPGHALQPLAGSSSTITLFHTCKLTQRSQESCPRSHSK